MELDCLPGTFDAVVGCAGPKVTTSSSVGAALSGIVASVLVLHISPSVGLTSYWALTTTSPVTGGRLDVLPHVDDPRSAAVELLRGGLVPLERVEGGDVDTGGEVVSHRNWEEPPKARLIVTAEEVEPHGLEEAWVDLVAIAD